MGVFGSLSISASGLTAERLRMDVISQNLANANTTRTESGGPYRRQVPVFVPHRIENGRGRGLAGYGVRVAGIVAQPGPGRMVYDPEHPDADERGYVEYPNVNVVTEMVDMISASRAYEANVTALNAVKAMANKALEIGK